MDVLKLRDIEWIEARDKLGRVVFGLSADDYEDLAMNTRATLRALEQRKAQVRYYRQCLAGLERPKAEPEGKPWWKLW